MADSESRLEKVLTGVFSTILPMLDEHTRRIFAGSVAKAYGYGGITLVSRLTGISPTTIRTGIKEIEEGVQYDLTEQDRVRKSGGGRKSSSERYPDLLQNIEKIIENDTLDDPERVIQWTSLRLTDISSDLKALFNIEAGKNVVSLALDELGYSKQLNRKMMRPGSGSVDRAAQFQFINGKAKEFIAAGDPVVSAGTGIKELVGNLKSSGSETRPAEDSRKDPNRDFPLDELEKVSPGGVYLPSGNTGFVNLGEDHGTGVPAAESIRRWWHIVGKETFPTTQRIYITCDGSGSERHIQLWKYALALLADETGLEIHVSHLPPSTFKWCQVKHRLICYTAKTWSGKSLMDISTIVSLISSAAAQKELTVRYAADTDAYQDRWEEADEIPGNIHIEYTGPNDCWNYIIRGFR